MRKSTLSQSRTIATRLLNYVTRWRDLAKTSIVCECPLSTDRTDTTCYPFFPSLPICRLCWKCPRHTVRQHVRYCSECFGRFSLPDATATTCADCAENPLTTWGILGIMVAEFNKGLGSVHDSRAYSELFNQVKEKYSYHG